MAPKAPPTPTRILRVIKPPAAPEQPEPITETAPKKKTRKPKTEKPKAETKVTKKKATKTKAKGKATTTKGKGKKTEETEEEEEDEGEKGEYNWSKRIKRGSWRDGSRHDTDSSFSNVDMAGTMEETKEKKKIVVGMLKPYMSSSTEQTIAALADRIVGKVLGKGKDEHGAEEEHHEKPGPVLVNPAESVMWKV